MSTPKSTCSCSNLAFLTHSRLDYCGPTSFIPDMAKKVKKLTLIDHHKTAVEIVAALREKDQLPSNGTSTPSVFS